ncbi:MAG: protein translocase subunit SecF, partial [Deltaproteobacteria bacterium]|nr:protein translocase subunit SecF [Deltaproteobacteria bacterium]MBW2535769.1 protein translocase subunit SecF [Deltaproteobacteria bacterium]
QPVDAGQLRQTVKSLGFAAPDVVAVGGDTEDKRYLIKVKEVSAIDQQTQTAVIQALCLIPEEGELNDPSCPPELQTQEVKFSPGGDKIAVRYVQSPCGAGKDEATCPIREEITKQLEGKVAGVKLRPGANNPSVQNPRDYKVEFYLESKGDQIMGGLRSAFGAEVVPDSPLRVEWIGPKAGRQLRDAAITSILIAVIFIMAYIAFRFDMRFAPGAIAALVHDGTLAVGAMVLAQREFTLSTVAALLTIVGYSINDTVVVYDRIRENLGKYRKKTFPEIINRSVTEMLGRTIRTSITTLFAIGPFLFWGTGVIRDFAFTLMVGVVVGTYSSIYVAAPLTEWIDRRFFGKSVQKKRRRVSRASRAGGGRQPRSRRYGDAVI